MIITAKFKSLCLCGNHCKKGEQIDYSYSTRKVIGCKACLGTKDRSEPDLGRIFDMAYEDQCRDMCGL